MTRTWRWWVVAGATVVTASVPVLLGALPVPGRTEDAATLLARMQAARDRPYEGYAESTGYLALPVSDQFDSVTELLGGRTQLRVWWRGARDWRVDTITPVGEQSQRSGPDGSWLWDFEDDRATRLRPEPDGAVRLPRAGDAIAPQLAARVLSEASPKRARTLPSRRVAGRAADGIRVTPDDPDSSITAIDVWADRASGIPVTVELYSAGARRAALTTTFLDFNPTTPSAAETAFAPPPGARVRGRERLDLVGAIGRFSRVEPPGSLAGYDRQPPLPGAGGVGLYGRGVTQFSVAPLPPRTAGSLRSQLQVAAGVVQLPQGLVASVGPVGLLLTYSEVTAGQSWLVTGTLTSGGLARVAADLQRAGP